MVLHDTGEYALCIFECAAGINADRTIGLLDGQLVEEHVAAGAM
jgi:hypothetical protein